MRRKAKPFDLAGYLAGPIQLTKTLTFVPAKRQVPLAFGELEGPFPSKPTVATIFLGLVTGVNIVPRRTFTVDDVTEALLRHLGRVGLEASVVSQVGIIKEKGLLKEEPSVQIMIIETEGDPWETFQGNTLDVARRLLTEFRQDRVYVAYVKEGEPQPTWELP